MPKRKQFTNPGDSKVYDIRQFMNCKQRSYLWCFAFLSKNVYRQELRRRVSKHISTIHTHADTPLARHVREVHQGDSDSLRFWGITKPKLGPRGGDLNKLLLKIEAQWIYCLKSLSPLSLNEGFSLSAFIEQVSYYCVSK